MANLAVQRSVARYHLRPSQLAHRGRLDSIFGTVFEDRPDLPLDLGTATGLEEICIRRVEVVVPVQLEASDATLTRGWARAIAREVGRRISNPGLSNGEEAAAVVRYSSRGAALVDLVQSAAAGSTDRAWAWAQMGLVRDGWTTARSSRIVVDALTGEPRFIVPVLVEVGRAETSTPLGEMLSGLEWWTLASAALAAAGAQSMPASLLAKTPNHWARRRATAIATRSLVWRSCPPIRSNAFVDERGPDALAILAVLETEPALLIFDPMRAIDVVAALVETAAVNLATNPVAEISALGAPGTDADAEPAAISNRDLRAATTRDQGAAQETPPEATPAAAPDVAPASRQPAEFRTEWGGLLFLLHLVDRLGLPEAITSEETFSDRPLDWVLHRLALQLAPISPDDPAALAFAGLHPRSDTPFSEPAGCDAQELAALVGMRAALVDELRDLLERRDDDEISLLAEITRRHARIDGEPGWLVVHLSLSSVSTELRRSGLDLDPGYVPWLGTVITFAYE